ncbi:hypothetical protein BTR22_01195 [Alkalihalophilus pseudofirmus]|uniref:hypothetical protein n=1 Tax=Alkalihalophilus pseudofirmus TaxID=79885 RepID=UPI0009523F10|nr:hypothetical protein BTR22_01195 [Alkalihalophilus pseudofirmus]
MTKEEKLQAFADKMKEGFRLLSEKRNEEAIETLKPFVELTKKSGGEHIRLFVHYSLAQIRTGDFNGFLETYEAVKKMKPKTTEEEKLKGQLDGFFNDLMEELGKSSGQWE